MLKQRILHKAPARRTPGYFWTLSEKISIPELREKLQDMCAHGAKSLCLHPLPPEFRPDIRSRMAPPYLSAEYNRLIGELVNACSKLGMKFFLYDEGGWPSGSACGQVVRSDPERFVPSFAVSDGEGGYKIIKNPVNPGGAARMPNLLVPGATEKFLELTHEAFKKCFGEHFGKTVHIAFTDEPTMPGSTLQKMAWVDDLPQEFEKRKGYDLRPFLGKLLDPETYPGTDLRRSKLADVWGDYCDVMSQLFQERYLLVLRKWCRKNGLLSGGHFGGEDSWLNLTRNGFGHILRSLRALDCPGIDMIWRQLYREERLHPFPKLASSAAHLNGNKDILAEMFAIYGNGLTPEDMKFLLDYMLVCGVNTFVFSSMPDYLSCGQLVGGRPCFGEADPLWKYFNEVHHYAGVMANLLSQGKPGAKLALFFDMRSLWGAGHEKEYSAIEQQMAAERLRRTQRDFDYVSDDEILSGRVRKGELVIGKMRYSALVLPPLCNFSSEVAAEVAKLRRAGLPVLTVSEAVATQPQTLKTESPAAWDLLVMKRVLGKGEALYMVMNTSGQPVKAAFSAVEMLPVAVADVNDGRFYTVPGSANGKWQWEFAPFESRCFVLGEVEVSPAPEKRRCIKNLTRWQIAPAVKYYAGEPCSEKLCVEPVTVKTGDWSAVLGSDFSGDAVYTGSFRGQEAEYLDLGVVKYACEVKINGKTLGRKFFPPYVFDLRGKLNSGMNHLEVTVTNTLANAITEDVQKYWAEKYPPVSPYNVLEKEFEKASLPSGLYGPVKLLK